MHYKTIEEHLRELGPLQTKREVSGLVPVSDCEVRYVEDLSREPFKSLFKRLVRHIDPPVMKGDGAAVIDGCMLTVPTGRRFQAIYYRGDIEGWRQQIAQGAAALQVTLGELVDGVLVLNDGNSYKLADCEVAFD